jgi:hypothetical protein
VGPSPVLDEPTPLFLRQTTCDRLPEPLPCAGSGAEGRRWRSSCNATSTRRCPGYVHPRRAGRGHHARVGLGLGPSVVAGPVTPDTYRVAADGGVDRVVADKRTRLDRTGTQLVVRAVPAKDRARAALDEVTAAELAALGGHVAMVMDSPQDIEWAIAGDRVWLCRHVRSRPHPRPPPPDPDLPRTHRHADGTPGSHGTATGTARTVRGPTDFARVTPGDIVVCPFTDPAWTPLLRIACRRDHRDRRSALPCRDRRSRARHPGRSRGAGRDARHPRRRRRHHRRLRWHHHDRGPMTTRHLYLPRHGSCAPPAARASSPSTCRTSR